MTDEWSVVRASEVPTQRWRNGAGTTRELWCEPGVDGAPAWRLSLADLVADASFSTFPAVDRVFLPLLCPGHALQVDGEWARLVPLSPLRFRGESQVVLSAPAPGLALNLMKARGTNVELFALRLSGGRRSVPGARAVMVLEGRLSVPGGPTVQPCEVVVLGGSVALRAEEDTLAVEIREGDATCRAWARPGSRN